MDKLILYRVISPWNAETLPELLVEQRSEEECWAKIIVRRGEITLSIFENSNFIDTRSYSANSEPLMIRPDQSYQIESASQDIECECHLYCRSEDFYSKKYGLTKTHSEVIEAAKIINPCKTLDLGCGMGRNTLYLDLLGFKMTSVDHNSVNIERLREITKTEKIQSIQSDVYNINEATITENYDFIFSTVVFMFLEAERVPSIIHNMQEQTEVEGYNLIVSAMSTKDYPCDQGFSFTFSEDELLDYYKHWKIIKYNEDIGELHRVDAEGNRVKLRFATLLAQKK